jgi:hypothetical protein
MFVAQSVLFAIWGVAGSRIGFQPRAGRARFFVGAVLIGYALLIYPLLAFAFGQRWPEMPSFGAPCPVVLFTFGVLWWTDSSIPKGVFVVPMLWALLGSSAAMNFRIYEDWALVVAAAATCVWIFPRTWTKRNSPGVANRTRTMLHRVG